NAANYRAMTAMHESMYRMQLQEQMMTPPEFQTYAHWPGDRPHFTEGVNIAAGDDDEDADEAAVDAFIDEEAT
ncbi:hypothetical protein A2U01_0080522, partial [Trifolium medium]|nr:hypothetical protein [Trifolium medium]